MKRFAVIPSRNRHEELGNLINDIGDEAVIIVVDNKSDPPIDGAIRCDDDPPSISRLWNIGLDEASRRADGTVYDVAVLNDDLRLIPGTLTKLSQAIRASTAAASFPDAHGRLTAEHIVIRESPGPYDLYERMTGYCFMLRGELELRLDESMRWWYSDDDLEWRAALAGGVARVGGCPVTHLYPSASTNERPELYEQAGRDRQRFVEKWHRSPW